MSKLLWLGLVAALASASVAASGSSPHGLLRPQAGVATPSHAVSARDTINCGFICDSFGRCRRVCW